MPTNYTKLLEESQKHYNPKPNLTPLQIVKIVAVANILGLVLLYTIYVLFR